MPFRTIPFDDMRDVITSSLDDGFPFSALTLTNDNFWPVAGDNTDEWLKLDDNDLPLMKGNAAYLRVAPDWKLTLVVKTPRNKFFQKNMKSSLPSGFKLSEPDTLLETYSQIEIPMTGGDYFSIDIDGDIDGVGTLKVYVGGKYYNISTPKEVDADVYIKAKDIQWNDPDYDPDNPQDTFIEPEDIPSGEPAANPDGEGGWEANPEAPQEPTTPQDDTPPEDGEETTEEPSSILWIVGIGLFVLLAVGVLTIKTRKGD